MTTLSPSEQVAAIEGRARRIETPCGDGAMVWRIWGGDRGDAAPLVLGHGAQGAWSHWIRNVAALGESRMVLAVDLPGHGDSALPATHDHEGIVAALAEGLAAIVGERPVDLAGFSFSGTCFAHLAAWHPERARRLILIGTGGLDTPHGPIDLRRVSGLEGEAREAAIRANILGLMIQHAETVDDLAMHLHMANARAARLKNAAQLVLPDRLKRVLPQVRAQVDAIWGAHDRPHPVEERQEDVLRALVPELDFRVIADAGHWAMYERPDMFNAALLDMLGQPLRAAG